MMLTLLGIYAKIKKDRRDQQSFCTTLTLEEKQAGWTSVSNFLFLQGSLMCRLVTCALILTHVMGLVR